VDVPLVFFAGSTAVFCIAIAALWRSSRGRLRQIERLEELRNEARSRFQKALQQEIAGRQNAEIALRESEKRFRLMVEELQGYAIFMLDTRGRVASWNLSAERVYRHAAEEIVGKHVSIFCPKEDSRRGSAQRGYHEDDLRLAATEGRVERAGWRVRRDGSRFWANVVITAVHDDAGDLCGFCQITRDMTEWNPASPVHARSQDEVSITPPEVRQGF